MIESGFGMTNERMTWIRVMYDYFKVKRSYELFQFWGSFAKSPSFKSLPLLIFFSASLPFFVQILSTLKSQIIILKQMHNYNITLFL